MNIDDVRLKAKCLLRRAGLQAVPLPVLCVVGVLCLVLVGVGVWHFWPASASAQSSDFSLEQADDEASNDEASSEEADAAVADLIKVDVEGAVVAPGVYELNAGARIDDAIAAAGGMTEAAVGTAVNRAQALSDGEQVYVPTQNEVTFGVNSSAAGTSASSGASSSAESEKISINNATAEELQELSGIGEVLSQRIIDYREKNGGFSSLEDLKNVSGIGDTRFEALKDSICL